jgi:DNA mismatch endonuclease (patch repair protein)
MDVHSKEQRSYNMSRIRSKNTKPEMVVRSLVHRLGYRYRLHQSDLPGKPDLVFSGKRKIIFVNGCYWHMHDCRYGRVIPKTNTEFWQTKRQGNVTRDQLNRERLEAAGWQVLDIWECQVKDTTELEERIQVFLR